jgi:hypothetical protein
MKIPICKYFQKLNFSLAHFEEVPDLIAAVSMVTSLYIVMVIFFKPAEAVE